MELNSYFWKVFFICTFVLLVFVFVHKLNLSTDLDSAIGNVEQNKAVELKPEVPTWVEVGLDNVHLYGELTETYKTLTTHEPLGRPDNEIIVLALLNIIEHLENMQQFYETAPFKPEIKKEFLGQSETRLAEWSALLAEWESGDALPVPSGPDQEPVQVTSIPQAPIQVESVVIPPIPEYREAEVKLVEQDNRQDASDDIKSAQVVIQNTKQDKQEHFDTYKLLELSLGMKK